MGPPRAPPSNSLCRPSFLYSEGKRGPNIKNLWGQGLFFCLGGGVSAPILYVYALLVPERENQKNSRRLELSISKSTPHRRLGQGSGQCRPKVRGRLPFPVPEILEFNPGRDCSLGSGLAIRLRPPPEPWALCPRGNRSPTGVPGYP